jgi:hypothetical protein
MDYLSDIQPLEQAGKTDAEIAAFLSAVTPRSILIADLENFLDFEGLAKRNPLSGAWEGVLPTEVSNNVYGLGAGLAALFSHINKPRSVHIDTSVDPWASSAHALLDGLLATGLITQAQYDGFYALGGGHQHNVTAQDVSDARTLWQAGELARVQEEAATYDYKNWVKAYWTSHNSTVAPVLDAGSVDDVALVAALRSLADSIERAW